MMTLFLSVLASPVPQPQTDLRLTSGRAVLGRDEGCEWRLEDPEMFVSRHHCLIESVDEGWMVTDTSSGGLFLDQTTTPLGPGRSAMLRDGMQMRLGDVVLAVHIASAVPDLRANDAAEPENPLKQDPFFSVGTAVPPPPSRPPQLPEPFEQTSGRYAAPVAVAPPPGFDDPFTLDPAPTSQPPALEGPIPGQSDWDWDTPATPAPWPSGGAAALPPHTQPATPPEMAAEMLAEMATSSTSAPDAQGAAAFLRGAGLSPADAGTLDLEALGRRYRMLVEGLVAQLRSRDAEKGSMRVARTTLGVDQVNPLKFLAIPDEQLAALIAPRGTGYLDPDAAIAESFRDLADHRLRSWQGLQAALRRMIDRFAPEAIEAELTDTGALRALLAGGHSALLWQAYVQRWAEIARAAEDRFLGEIGADFRDAYETPDRREP